MSGVDVQSFNGLSKIDQQKYINSFDTILFDCDGVLWPLFGKRMSGTGDVLKGLQKMGKKIGFVTNNSFTPVSQFAEKLRTFEFEFTEEMLINPTVAIIKYLKLIKFNKKIFAAASTSMKKELEDAGFSVVAPHDGRVELTKEDMQKYLVRDPDIGLVIVDFYLNLSLYTAFNCVQLLKNPEVLYIIGVTDKVAPVSQHIQLVGPHYIQASVNELSKREPLIFGKPGKHLGDFIKELWNIENPERTLFVGDMLESDMCFASTCGFHKLLVLSGVTSWEQLQNCDIKEQIPDYYMNSIADLLPILPVIKE